MKRTSAYTIHQLTHICRTLADTPRCVCACVHFRHKTLENRPTQPTNSRSQAESFFDFSFSTFAYLLSLIKLNQINGKTYFIRILLPCHSKINWNRYGYWAAIGQKKKKTENSTVNMKYGCKEMRIKPRKMSFAVSMSHIFSVYIFVSLSVSSSSSLLYVDCRHPNRPIPFGLELHRTLEIRRWL